MSDSSRASTRDEFQDLWSSLPVPAPVTADQMRRRATDLAAWKHRRAVGVAVVILLASGQAVTAVILARPLAPWEWAGVVYLVALPAWLLWITLLGRRGASSTLEGSECVRVYRSLLEHERDANRGRTLASRVLLVFVVLAASAIIAVKAVPAAFWPITVVALAASGVLWHRGRARARLLQLHIEAMDTPA